ncbi:MAG TPA: 30S ribosomal protein S16 [Candidatus Sulfotelmatobacter sp.]|jgi:small subunit ribosomal protein S16|nr:30S ribosomal protein S16 [Candidatus Sulfotelmatobacter sp.]
MSLVIRLTRTGKKGERKFRVVVKEKRSKRDGGFIDMLGWYEKTKDNKRKKIDMEKYQYWVSKGAQPSATMQEIIK